MEQDVPHTHPELLKYLRGEITFDTWLENQQQDNDNNEQSIPSNTIQEERASTSFPVEETGSMSIFSSWGSAFTHGSSGMSKFEHDDTSDEKVPLSTEDSDVDIDEQDDSGDDEISVMRLPAPKDTPTQEKVNFKVDLPNFDGLCTPDSTESQSISWLDLKGIIEDLSQILPTSTVFKKYAKGRKRKLTEESSAVEVPDIVKDFQDFQLRKRGNRKGSRLKRNRLPELSRLQMGQANLLVAKRDFKQAANICMEIIKEAPYSGLPFKTLSFIYEEQGDKEMSLQYSLIYAFLDCQDSQEWKDLAKKCFDGENPKQALVCYDNACKYKPFDISLQWERALKYFQYQDYRKCLEIYFFIHKRIQPGDTVTYLNCAKKLTKIYHRIGLTDRAVLSLKSSFDICPASQDYEAVNLLSELYIARKEYDKVIEVIHTQCNVSIPGTVLQNIRHPQNDENLKKLNEMASASLLSGDMQKQTASTAAGVADQLCADMNSAQSMHILHGTSVASPQKKYTTLQPRLNSGSDIDTVGDDEMRIPERLPLDLRVKLAQCLVYCNELDDIENIIYPLFSEDMNDVGDLVLEIGETFYEIGYYEESLKYILEVVASEKFNQAAVWLKLAEIYQHLGQIDQSIDAYYQVLALAPLKVSIRMALASALKEVGRNEEALTVLADYDDTRVDADGEETDSLSIANRLQVEEYQEWYEKCVNMYTNHRVKDFLSHGYILLHNYLMSNYGYQKKQMVSKVQMWDMLQKILRASIKMKQHQKGITLLEQALNYKPYGESQNYRLELDYLLTTTCFVAGEYSKAFDSFRVLIMHEQDKQIEGIPLWNLFTQIVNKMMDKRHHRFSLRLLFKRPNLVPLVIQNGNNSHLSGTYKYAIGEFSRAFREWPTDPLNSMLLAVSFLHLSCQKFHKTRHASSLHGIIFMFQYFYTRGESQEAHYNLARAFHQIGLIHLAVHYYNNALNFPLHNENTAGEKAEYHPFIDLHREAAYNLARIYEHSGNKTLARSILRKYCWV